MRKVVDAMPESHQVTAGDVARRFLVEPETDLLSRRPVIEEVPAATMLEVRRAVLGGRRLRIRYEAVDRAPRWRTVDPIGLVTVRDKGYLLATVDGDDRTYRLSRILAAQELPEAAQRPDQVDLDRIWRERSTRFRAGGDQVTVVLRLALARREELVTTALAVLAEGPDADGRLRMEVTFQDLRHAVWALWQLGPGAEALAPPSLRTALHERAIALAARYAAAVPDPAEAP